MAGIIFKWRYLKAGASGRHSENLIRYIAQREGVEKLDDSWKHRPVTKAQTELITQILSDYPDAKDSFEYQDYEKSRTAGAASEFITRAIEERVDLIGKRENYVEYIAKRPRVERHGSHGLFTDDGVPINLSAAAKEVANHKGVVFTEILSLRREDAVRLGYDKGSAWRDLLRSQTDAMDRLQSGMKKQCQKTIPLLLMRSAVCTAAVRAWSKTMKKPMNCIAWQRSIRKSQTPMPHMSLDGCAGTGLARLQTRQCPKHGTGRHIRGSS